jgi:hypothetical protein
MSPVRIRVVGCAVAVLTAAALSGCGGGGKPATPVSTPIGAPPSATGPTTPQSAPSNAAGSAPVPAAPPAAPSAAAPSAAAPGGAASGPGGAPLTGAATPGGQDDTATLNQIDSDLANVDGALSTSDSVRAQETN